MLDSPECDLPDFGSPPVVETVLSAQFEKLPAMRSAHFGLFWPRVRRQFPNTEEHPALDSIVEQAKEPLSHAVQLRFEALDSLSPGRLWFVNTGGDELIQIQNDRFIKNWRKRSDEYPHYENFIKPAFERDFREFQAFVSAEKLGEVKVNQCEVTYVNHIVSGEGWADWNEAERVFTFLKNPHAEPYPGRAEDVSFRARFPILGPNNEWVGRLHLDVQPAIRTTDNRPMYVMNLTARGMYGEGVEFFDIGHQCVVKSFERLTTEGMHKLWRRKT